MASDEREAPGAVSPVSRLGEHPEHYHVFQALRLIEAAYGDSPRLGRSTRPKQDPVRLKQRVDMAFAPSTITKFRPRAGKNGAPGEVVQLMFGMFGPNGPLPLHLTEYTRNRVHSHRDPTMSAFADIFHHRMLSLLYRAYASASPAASFDRHGEDDPFADMVASLVGLKGRSFDGRDEMPDLAKLRYAGRLAQGAKNEEGLVALVAGYFGTPARLETFIGCWLELDRQDTWQLGDARNPARLGQTCSLGSKVWTRHAKFRFAIGPVSLADYKRLLPDGTSLGRLRALVRNYLGDTYDWDVNLILKKGEAEPLKLGEQGQLGWTTWLGNTPKDRDLDDLYLNPHSSPHVSAA
ncbi:type VI secretion system baseplate subunit TssG [Abyssibius alkaniclasticus]|uniref:type VI secretion system baseplate subunit TssG n=1 Tax=Abyssibius alkaniclasticus TaxID=2881234 RepID=UPI002364454B|nr:type VI secretion system baseplate subunit TssG [Abyssibius alkaniclasticus]UPH72385.1 type VI secretion system baseplate subunit TssG [Abyssibius alkaniclasticus]